MSEDSDEIRKPGRIWRRRVYFGIPMVGAAAAFAAGIIFWGGFNTVVEATNTMPFCISCHEMRDNVYEEYRHTIHYKNRTGVSASCSDCHVPDPWVHKMVRKVQASNELLHNFLGTIDTREKFEANRLRLAQNVWRSMKATDSRECRNCHTLDSMAPQYQAPRARQQHLVAMETGQTCIDCHKGIAHNSVRELLDEEELERLEAPVAAHIREVPQTFLDSLAYITEVEASESAKAAEEARAAEAAIAARIAAAVEEAKASVQPDASAPASGPGNAAPAGDGGGDVAAGIDWAAVPEVVVPLFYPGQASWEWVQNGRDHGGARAFLRAGDRCSTCHARETEAIGTKIVSGEILEPTPIPGKRGAFDLTVQATRDEDTLYIRARWPNAAHAPAPFAEGGKMEPEHPARFAMMIAGEGIERVEQAGCWATCHIDSRYMPEAPEAGAVAASGLADRLHAEGGVTKYLPESRTEIELKGKDRPMGGWDLLRAEAEIEAYLEAGAVMDLIRVTPAGEAQSGHILERRVEHEVELAGEMRLEGDTWTMVMARPLAASGPGDVAIEPGKTYTVGFAVHDDHSYARFHHVSLDLRLSLDDAEAEIRVSGP